MVLDALRSTSSSSSLQQIAISITMKLPGCSRAAPSEMNDFAFSKSIQLFSVVIIKKVESRISSILICGCSDNILDLLRFIIVLSCYCGLSEQQFGFPEPFPNRGSSQSAPSAVKVSQWLPAGQELVFSNSESTNNVGSSSTTQRPNSNPSAPVFVNNVPVIATLVPFMPTATTASPSFLACFERCPTTSEYNPICANNRQLYANEQKFNCARLCGAGKLIVYLYRVWSRAYRCTYVCLSVCKHFRDVKMQVNGENIKQNISRKENK